jgi:hypothetical protein
MDEKANAHDGVGTSLTRGGVTEERAEAIGTFTAECIGWHCALAR